IPIPAANANSKTSTPPTSTVLSPVPNVEVAQSLTGNGVASITACPTASTGDAAGVVSPANSCATPIAAAAAMRPETAPARTLGRGGLGLGELGVAGFVMQVLSCPAPVRYAITLPGRRR